jgi:hypothetical protein
MRGMTLGWSRVAAVGVSKERRNPMPERRDVNERLLTQSRQTTESFGAIGASRTPVTRGQSISIYSGQRGPDVDLQRRGWAHVSPDGPSAPHFLKETGLNRSPSCPASSTLTTDS